MKDDFAESSENGQEQLSGEQEALPEDKEQQYTQPAAAKAAREKLFSQMSGVFDVFLKVARPVRRFFKKDSAPNLVLVLLVITVAVAAGLGAVYTITEPLISESKSQAFDESMGTVFPGYDLTFTVSSIRENVFEGRDASGDLVGFSVRVSPGGYGGTIDMIVGINLQREITGIAIVSHRETRGFDSKGNMQGGFPDQFIGLSGPFSIGDQVDAISGATVSSTAVTQGINDALNSLETGVQP